MDMGYLYKITNKVNNKCYVGSSIKDPNDNWSYYGSGKLIKQAIEKYGKSNFTKEILVESDGDIKTIEKQYLEEINAQENPMYYNMTNDAVGSSFHGNKGKKSTSEKLTGRKLSTKTKEKISKNKTGIRFKNGYNTKIKTKPGVSKAHKGRISPNQNKGYSIKLYDAKTGEYLSTYDNANRLSEELNISNETVRCCLIGKQKTICNKKYFVKYSETLQ